MDFALLETYISPPVLVLIPVLYLIGMFLRQTPYIPPWVHAWILLGVAYVACIFLLNNTIHAFIQAVLVSGASMFVKDLFAHTMYAMKGQEKDPITGQYIQKNGKNGHDTHE